MLFGKKEKMPPEQRREMVQAIEKLIDAGKSEEAFRLTKTLEKEDADAAGLAMAYFYFMGENVREDYNAAARSAQRYLRIEPEDALAWNRLGSSYMLLGNYDQAAPALEKGYQLGNIEAGTLLANVCKIQADRLRGDAAGTLNARSFGRANGQAMTLYTKVILLGEAIGAAHPGMMNDADWQGYGRAFDMMYALALGGETRSFRVSGNAFSTYASVAKAFEAGRDDRAGQGVWLAAAVRGCALMEAAGYKAMAEYFRAALCLDAVDFSKSGKMLAAAKWHLDRAAELNGTLTAEQKAEYPNDFADYRQQYQQYLRRYGKAMEAQLKAGQLPDLAGEYPAGTAPAPQSCALFMKDVEALQSGAPLPGAPKKKGFFGLFG